MPDPTPASFARARSSARVTYAAARGTPRSGFVCALPALLIVGVCCGLPLIWTAMVIIRNPAALADARLSGFRAELLARTLGYNVFAAVIATLMSLPAAFVMGRGRGLLAKSMWLIAPAALLLPFLSFGYGWSQVFRLCQPLFRSVGIGFLPAGTADTLRCIWTLSSWLWGVPACIVGLQLRRLDPELQMAALMQGAQVRVTLRLLLGPILASAAILTVLATQEFAVYEPTGVSVVATEVRMVFSTGAFSSLPNGGLDQSAPDQSQRASAAVMTAAPLLAVTVFLAALVARFARQLSPGTSLHVGDWARVLDARGRTTIAAAALVILNIAVPIAGLILSLKSIDTAARLWAEFGRAAVGSLTLFAVAAGGAGIVSMSASAFWIRGLLGVSVLSFLLGGEILAIALIRLFNRPGLGWAGDSWILPTLAYLGRFSCIALVAGHSTWLPSWDELRNDAALSGAGPLQLAARIVWPIALPIFVAAALLVGALSLTEVAATATLIPQHPPVLTNKLLTWAHAARSDRMIEGSLLIIGLVLIPVAGAFVLAWIARRSSGEFKVPARSGEQSERL